MEVPIPATAFYCRNWRAWNDHQPRHVNINSNVTDSNRRTYNNHLLFIVNTDSIASKTWRTYDEYNLGQYY